MGKSGEFLDYSNELGSFTSKLSAREAFIGATSRKEKMDIRSQVLGTPDNAFKQVDTFTPAQLRAKEAITGLQHGQEWKTAVQNKQVADYYQSNGIGKTLRADYLMQLEPQIWAAIDKQLGKEGKQQLLTAIEAKKAQTKQTENVEAKQQAITSVEQVAITQQLQAEASKIALQAPAEVIVGGLALLAIWVIRRLPDRAYKVLGATTILTLILAACSVVSAATPTQEAPSENNNPVSTEVANLPDSEKEPTAEVNLKPTEIAPTQDPAEIIKKEMESAVTDSLAADPDQNKAYVQYVDALDGKPMTQEGIDFLNVIGVNGKGIVDDKYITIGVNQYGILYAEHVDGTQIVFNIKDLSDNYLIATKQEAFDRLSSSNPAAVEGKTIDDFTLTADTINSVLASLLDKDGNPVEGVNAQTRQWQAIDTNGALVGNPGEVPTATIGAKTSDEGLLASNQEVITSMVKDFAANKIEFPTDLTPEQYSAFIKEMNSQYSNKPIWVEAEDASHNKVTLFHNITTNEMETLPGSYLDNKDTIDKNFYSTYVEIHQEKGTGNLQFVDPNTGELATVPNSANIDWNLVIDDKNLYDGAIKLPTDKDTLTEFLVSRMAEEYPSEKDNLVRLVQVVLIDNKPVTLTRVSRSGRYWDLNCLEMLFIKTDQAGKPLYAIKAFVGAQAEMKLTAESSSAMDKLNQLNTTAQRNKLKSSSTYFVALSPQQNISWEGSELGSMDKLENVTSATQAYDAAVENKMPNDSNIILITSLLIEKK